MELDFSSVLLAILCLALFAVPMYLSSRSSSKLEKKFLKTLIAAAQKQQLHIHESIAWNNQYALGFDQQAGKILYLKMDGETVKEELLIDLKSVKQCEIINQNQIINGNRVFYRLALIFHFKNKNHAAETIDFFSGDATLTLNGELQLMNKWHELIKNNL